jgi:hypothetical protein
MRQLGRRGAAVLSTLVLATAGLAFAAGARAGAGRPDGASTQRSYDEEGAHTYVVPDGVCSVTVEVWGAEGGEGETAPPPDIADAAAGSSDHLFNRAHDTVSAADTETAGPGDSDGGEGGYATATIPVTPGETLDVNVGEQGSDADGVEGGEGGDSAAGNGGDGGDVAPFGPIGSFAAGGGGGGASSVARAGEHLVLAGGGGGGGGTLTPDPDLSGTAGGDGGGEGEDGATPELTSGEPALAAEGGEAGGEGGEGGDGAGISDVEDGDDGTHNDGGEGGEADFQGGGGGGGGATGGGGGGGSGLEALIGGGGGGGGSGHGPEGTSFEEGEREGDGKVTIGYDPVLDACVEAVEVEPKFTG